MKITIKSKKLIIKLNKKLSSLMTKSLQRKTLKNLMNLLQMLSLNKIQTTIKRKQGSRMKKKKKW